MLTYENFFPADDVATYKRIKASTMQLARTARQIACEMVGGEIPARGKEFVHTSHGIYRLSMGSNADNTTEKVAHWQMRATPIVMGDPHDLSWWFSMHGLDDDAVDQWQERVRAAMS